MDLIISLVIVGLVAGLIYCLWIIFKLRAENEGLYNDLGSLLKELNEAYGVNSHLLNELKRKPIDEADWWKYESKW